MAETRPTGEQLRFNSVNTGAHSLDTYLENSEIGGRALYDLLGDIFDSSGNPDPNIFQFRVDPATYKFQVRIGQFVGTNAGWIDVPDGSFFNPTGQYQVGVDYEIHDLFHYNDNLYMVTVAHTSGATPDPASTFVAVAGASGAVPQTSTQLSGQAGKYLKVNSTQNGYDLVSFADSPVFFGFKMDGAQLQVEEEGRALALSHAALLQSLNNYVAGSTDPLVTSGFWDLTFTHNSNPYKYWDADMDGDASPDLDDVTSLANIINGTVTAGVYFNEWQNTILPHLAANRSTYENMVIPFAYGADYALYSMAPVSSSAAINPEDYDTWMLGAGSLNISVQDNNLVITV